MKKRTYILAGLVLTALVGASALWNWTARTSAAQKSADDLGIAVAFDARSEFSHTQNPNGVWTYGYSNSDTDNTLNLFTFPADSATAAGCSGGSFESWRINNGDQIPQIARHNPPVLCFNIPGSALFIHPGYNNQRAVVRWTAPAAGTFQVTGTFQKQNSSATTDLKIIKNAATPGESVLFTGTIGTVSQHAFDFTATVAAGETLDFSVGDADNGQFFDGSSISVNIGQPVTACLTAPADLQVNVPGENSPSDVESLNTNAQAVGGATYDTGKVGRGFKFDGDGDYVRVEDNAAQRPNGQLTAEGWFKFNDFNNFPHLISKPLRNTALNSFALWYQGGMHVGYYAVGEGFYDYNTGFVPQPGVFYHYAMVLNTDDAGPNANTLKLYVNGTEIFSGAAGNQIYYNSVNDSLMPHPLLLGADFESNNPQYFLNGAADEVSLYSRALTAAEIASIAQRGSFGKCPPPACAQPPQNLVSWYAGEQNAIDSRGGNHGTNYGAAFIRGKVAEGFSFDGVDDYIDLGTYFNYQNYTISMWVNPGASQSPSATMLDNNHQGFDNFSIEDYFGGYAYIDTSGAHSFNLTQDVWQHLTIVRTASTLQIYRDNTLVINLTGIAAPGYIAGSRLYAGRSGRYGRYWNGKLDELAVFDRALSASEIAAVYNAGQSGKCRPAALNPPANQKSWLTADGETANFVGTTAGVLQGNAGYAVGKVAQAFNLDGDGDYVEIPDSDEHRSSTGQLTAETWVRFNNRADFQHIISKPLAGSASNSYVVWYAGGEIRGGNGNLSSFTQLGSGFNPNPGTWYHVAFTISGATSRLYINGVEYASSGSAPALYFDAPGSARPLLLGAENEGSTSPGGFVNGQIDETGIYDRALSGSEIQAIYNAGVAGKLKAKAVNFVAPAIAKSVKTRISANALLSPAAVELSDATVTFASVTASGTVSENGVDLAFLPPLPTSVTFTGLAYDISTTAGHQQGSADDVEVCFNLPALAATFSSLRILHLEGGTWINRTAVSNTSPNLCTDNLTSLPGAFVIVEALAPTAARVSVSGRVSNSNGTGIGGATVTLTDSQGVSRSVRTGSFGSYSFKNVAAGEIYIVGVSARRYTFTVSSQALNVQDAVENVNFTADSDAFGAALNNKRLK